MCGGASPVTLCNHLPLIPSASIPQARASAATRAATSGGTGSIYSVERHRHVLLDGRAFEQHAARADDAEAIERGEPLVAVGDVGGQLAEYADLPLIREARAGHQIDEHFGGAGVEPADRHAFAGRDRQLLQAQRPQALVALLDAGHLQNGRHACGFAFRAASLDGRGAPAGAPRARRSPPR